MAIGPVITQGLGSFSSVDKIVTLGYVSTDAFYSLQVQAHQVHAHQVQAHQVYMNGSVQGTVQPPKTILEISHELR